MVQLQVSPGLLKDRKVSQPADENDIHSKAATDKAQEGQARLRMDSTHLVPDRILSSLTLCECCIFTLHEVQHLRVASILCRSLLSHCFLHCGLNGVWVAVATQGCLCGWLTVRPHLQDRRRPSS